MLNQFYFQKSGYSCNCGRKANIRIREGFFWEGATSATTLFLEWDLGGIQRRWNNAKRHLTIAQWGQTPQFEINWTFFSRDEERSRLQNRNLAIQWQQSRERGRRKWAAHGVNSWKVRQVVTIWRAPENDLFAWTQIGARPPGVRLLVPESLCQAFRSPVSPSRQSPGAIYTHHVLRNQSTFRRRWRVTSKQSQAAPAIFWCLFQAQRPTLPVVFPSSVIMSQRRPWVQNTATCEARHRP